jgi:hypothetical protein
MECEPPFWKNSSILFNNFSLQYKPTCKHSTLNFVTRILLLSLFVGMIASVIGGLSMIIVALLFGGITSFSIIMTTPVNAENNFRREIEHKREEQKEMQSQIKHKYHDLPYVATVEPTGYLAPTKEHFVNGGTRVGSVQPTDPYGIMEIDASPYSGPALPDYTPPTSRNPFMNVLIDEMKYNPMRPESAPVDHPSVKQTMDDFFRIQWFSDPTDVFGKNQSQRQFITQPSTTVPNDQGSFADWLYKIPGKTCKEGGHQACLSGSDESSLPWLNA